MDIRVAIIDNATNITLGEFGVANIDTPVDLGRLVIDSSLRLTSLIISGEPIDLDVDALNAAVDSVMAAITPIQAQEDKVQSAICRLRQLVNGYPNIICQ